jgi:hypothetical protein
MLHACVARFVIVVFRENFFFIASQLLYSTVLPAPEIL